MNCRSQFPAASQIYCHCYILSYQTVGKSVNLIFAGTGSRRASVRFSQNSTFRVCLPCNRGPAGYLKKLDIDSVDDPAEFKVMITVRWAHFLQTTIEKPGTGETGRPLNPQIPSAAPAPVDRCHPRENMGRSYPAVFLTSDIFGMTAVDVQERKKVGGDKVFRNGCSTEYFSLLGVPLACIRSSSVNGITPVSLGSHRTWMTGSDTTAPNSPLPTDDMLGSIRASHRSGLTSMVQGLHINMVFRYSNTQ